MQEFDIPQLRLMNTGLGNSPFLSPADVVSNLGAVQSQDFAFAKWSIGLRMRKSADETVERAFNEGKILRIHVMRPTWHFVMPEDIRWMLKLTAPNVEKILAPYDKKLKITQEVLSQSQSIFHEALKGKQFLTRMELGDQLERDKILARGQRLGHIIAHAELNGLICNGPKRGKQFTYRLLEEFVPKSNELNREKAIEKLATKYIASHGPAQMQDFAWWSGLSAKDAKDGLNSIKSSLAYENFEGKTYWYSPNTGSRNEISPTEEANGEDQAFLLSMYDEFVIAYRDRRDIIERRDQEILFSSGSAFRAVIILGRRVAGSWKQLLKKDKIEIKLNPFRKLSATDYQAVKKAASRYGEFMEKNVLVSC
jgi:hypothetical protein